jgi:hypothetical protein
MHSMLQLKLMNIYQWMPIKPPFMESHHQSATLRSWQQLKNENLDEKAKRWCTLWWLNQCGSTNYLQAPFLETKLFKELLQEAPTFTRSSIWGQQELVMRKVRVISKMQ